MPATYQSLAPKTNTSLSVTEPNFSGTNHLVFDVIGTGAILLVMWHIYIHLALKHIQKHYKK